MAGRNENLKPWKPGQTGNPGGCPKRDLAAELRKGNFKVFTALANRAYGKPHQSLDFSTGDGEHNSACIRVVFVKPDSRSRANERQAGESQTVEAWPEREPGRPKKQPLTDELMRLLEQDAPNAQGKSWALVIAEALLKKARKGDVRAVSVMANRTEGRPHQSLAVDANANLGLEERIAEARKRVESQRGTKTTQ